MAEPIIPFDYSARLRRQSQGRQPLDRIDEALDNRRSRLTRESILNSPPPDDVARVERVAREAGENPGDVEGNADAYERAVQARRFGDLARTNPSVGRWAAENPRGAAMAADDHSALDRIGQAWTWLKTFDPVAAFARTVDEFDRTDRGSAKDSIVAPVYAGVAAIMGDTQARVRLPAIASEAPSALASGAVSLVAGGLGYARGLAENRALPSWMNPGVAALATIGANRAKRTADELRPRTGDWLTDQVLGGISNVPSTAVGLAGGLAARGMGLGVKASALAGSALGGITQGGSSYNEARDQGVDTAKAFLYANTDLLTEVAGEYLGNAKFLRLTDQGANVITRFIKSQVPEVAGEEFSQVAQSLSAWMVLPENKTKTFGEWASGLPGEMAATAVQTLVTSGISNVSVSAMEKAVDGYGERLRREAGNRLGDRARQALEARRDRAFLDTMEKAVASSKLKGRDGVAMSALQRMMSEDADVTHAFIPACPGPYRAQGEVYA